MVHLEAANVQQHMFRFASAVDGHANVRPKGVTSIQIFGAFDTAPVADSDFELLGSTTRMNATLNFPISDASKSIGYRFRCLNTKDQPNPWFNSITDTILTGHIGRPSNDLRFKKFPGTFDFLAQITYLEVRHRDQASGQYTGSCRILFGLQDTVMTSTREERPHRGPLLAAFLSGGLGLLNLSIGFNRPSIADMRTVDLVHLLATGACLGVALTAVVLYIVGRRKS